MFLSLFLIGGLLLLALLPNQRLAPQLIYPVSDCITFRIICDVPRTAVFCSVSIEYSPGMASKFFLHPPIIIPMAPLITSKIQHFIFYILYICIQKNLKFIYLLHGAESFLRS